MNVCGKPWLLPPELWDKAQKHTFGTFFLSIALSNFRICSILFSFHCSLSLSQISGQPANEKAIK